MRTYVGIASVLLVLGSMAAVYASSGDGRHSHGEQSSGSGSSSSPNCLNELAPCLNYLNGNGNGNERRGGDDEHPPDSCCDPLKQVIKKKGECLCSLISNEGSARAEQAGINITRAQQLPALCGQHVNPLSCLKTTPPSSTKTTSSSSNTYSSSCRLFPQQFFNSLLMPWALLTCLAIFVTQTLHST